uniref:NADH-ubiquinone oxidoreductase chain 2 n=1 Tax=Curculionoidea sp. 8 KM-2017 TaxID=2219421 RepID=A0A346RJZ8_9CUCU|nr:NADH dehydrogenase subunit 2 [Curculionoidea sp. 8 KM-2017]
MKNFYKLLFSSTLMMGTLITISSMSWIMAWIGLEINLLSLMPLMKTFKNKYSSEASIKYFITQAMASSMLLMSVIIFFNLTKMSSQFNENMALIINFPLLMKMGAAPFHFWFPEVMSGVNWNLAFILMTWQKIAPMVLLMYTTQAINLLTSIIIMSSMISGIQGLNQTCLRKILAYSSINHSSWMISTILNSSKIWLIYFLVYSIINFNIIVILNKFNIYFMNQLIKLISFNKNLKFKFMSNFLSLGGLPPFLGFLPKWLTINMLVNNNFYWMSIILIIFTLISLFIYLRLSFSTFSLNYNESLIKTFKKINFNYIFINTLALSSLILCSLFMN